MVLIVINHFADSVGVRRFQWRTHCYQVASVMVVLGSFTLCVCESGLIQKGRQKNSSKM